MNSNTYPATYTYVYKNALSSANISLEEPFFPSIPAHLFFVRSQAIMDFSFVLANFSWQRFSTRFKGFVLFYSGFIAVERRFFA